MRYVVLYFLIGFIYIWFRGKVKDFDTALDEFFLGTVCGILLTFISVMSYYFW